MIVTYEIMFQNNELFKGTAIELQASTMAKPLVQLSCYSAKTHIFYYLKEIKE